MNVKNIFCFGFILLFMGLHTNAQKQFSNGISISIGSEFIADEPLYFSEYYSIFTQKPMYGAQLGYERRFGNLISVEVLGTFFYGNDKEKISFETEPDPLLPSNMQAKHGFQRLQIQLATHFWIIQKKKYNFSPGMAFTYGRTLVYNYVIKEVDFKNHHKSNHHYANVSLELTNRFLIKRLRSERKGTYGDLQLLVTPYLLANVYKKLDWQVTLFDEPVYEPLFGAGLFVGLGFSF